MQLLCPKQILISLYNTLILPHINYCLFSWGSSNATESIFLQQKKAIRAISSAIHNAHTQGRIGPAAQPPLRTVGPWLNHAFFMNLYVVKHI